jgi:hypothetical protein
MIVAQDRDIQSLVADIRDGNLLLPEMQRRYVWKSSQVRDLFDSLYHQYPSGQLLIWETNDLPYARKVSVDELDTASIRPQLLLDGQQRLTSLTAILLSRPLNVRGLKRPISIVFNVLTEKFEVAGPRQRGQAGWISLSNLFTNGVVAVLRGLRLDPASEQYELALERLSRVEQIKAYRYRVNLLQNLAYLEVTHIFVRINSGGTKLGSADLALAQVSSRWRGVSQEFDQFQSELDRSGLEVDSGLFLRAMAVLATGQSRLSLLFRGERQQLGIEELAAAWKRVKVGMRQALNFLVENCRIDRLSLLPTNNILIPLTAFFDKFGASSVSAEQVKQLQRWVYLVLIWSRYSATVETKLDQEVSAISRENPVQGLIDNIRDQVGRDREVTERDLRDQRRNSPYMLMAYVLARMAGAQDWFNGVVIGPQQKQIEFHHVFPKAVLQERYDLRADSLIIDQVANLAFLSRKANATISKQSPAQYLPSIDPSRLQAQLIPLEPGLWSLESFEDFVLRRRMMLADAINQLLRSLQGGHALWTIGKQKGLEERVDQIEEQLRSIVVDRANGRDSEDVWTYLIPAAIRQKLEGRISGHVRNNPADSAKFGDLDVRLQLCQFSEYPSIIRHRWEDYEQVFGNISKFEQHISAVTEARNAFKHNRESSPSGLAAAEAGLLWLEECMRSRR